MNGGYKKAMDGIRFSEDAKERMARNLVAAQGASHAPVASATRQARERTPVRARAGGKRRWQAVAAAAAAVGVLAVLGGAAYASGALMTMAEAVDAAFTGAPAMVMSAPEAYAAPPRTASTPTEIGRAHV